MYAIIATGGKQYTVKEGDEIVIEKLGVEDVYQRQECKTADY